MSLVQSANDLFNSIVPLMCTPAAISLSALNITPWQFAFAKAAVYGLAFVGVATAWYASRKRFNVNGFANPVWRTSFLLLIGLTAFQIVRILLTPMFGDVVPCPNDMVLSMIVIFLVLYAVWFWHLGKGNKGTFRKFATLIVTPLLGDASLSTRQAVGSGAKFLFEATELATRTLSHLVR